MDNRLTLGSGRQIACRIANTGSQYREVLHIHTDAVDFAEAAKLFGDPRETETIKFEDAGNVHVFRGYTVLHKIEEDPMIREPGMLLIWLLWPEKEE